MKILREKLIQKTVGAHDELKLPELFAEFDTNKSGLLTLDELQAMML